ncbi:MAG: tetratricopeptide repeat protein [Nitrospiraceae bacterium]|nr:tetratricopeptide repeat protein [Nitrospiraceae bacterium]
MDISELNQHVRSHPNDHEQRWRLAKKLYRNGQHEAAVEHLQIVRQYRDDKLHVVRFLAATYYRLERYEEAAEELKEAVAAWPDELELREQLGRALRMAGRRDEAREVWREILKREPGNKLATKSLARLARQEKDEPEPEPIPDSELGVGADTGIVCPSCGAVNTEEFERCWKCHGIVSPGGLSLSEPPPRQRESKGQPTIDLSDAWHIFGGICAFSLYAIALLISLKIHSSASGGNELDVSALLSAQFFNTRLILGGVLLILWPLALWLAIIIGKTDGVLFSTLGVTGAFCAGVAFVATLLPLHLVVYALFLVMLLSLAPIVLTFQLRLGQAVLVWGVHCFLVAVVVAVTFLAAEGVDAVLQWPAVARYAREHASDTGLVTRSGVRLPLDVPIRWKSTGSSWLDARLDRVRIEVVPARGASGITVELRDKTGTRYFERVGAAAHAFTFAVELGRDYQFIVTGEDGSEVDVVFHGVLVPELGG